MTQEIQYICTNLEIIVSLSIVLVAWLPIIMQLHQSRREHELRPLTRLLAVFFISFGSVLSVQLELNYLRLTHSLPIGTKRYNP